ncbi:MAG: hypothetical protein K6U10_02565 [Acidobacteriia bacterium]|nr:hypothetical protein [Methyloceanibacter sp.]MBX5473376.1 hypothetical protein [Acetobacteraceae bacterium]MCL6490685.1 hypothetical protein [Terriglobia bacterium]
MLSSNTKKPTQVCLRRAVSSLYYALFHCLARECADLLIGGPNSGRSPEAWLQVYRSLEHGIARERCKNTKMLAKFPNGIQDFADAFVEIQQKRYDADYNPSVQFAKASVKTDLILVEGAIAKFLSEPKSDRRAFCVYILFKQRK